MELVKKYFPFSFMEKEDASNLALALLIYLVAALAVSIVMWALGWIPFIKFIIWIAGGIAELYVVAGIAFAFLDFFKVLK